jgi:hypothetical protein
MLRFIRRQQHTLREAYMRTFMVTKKGGAPLYDDNGDPVLDQNGEQLVEKPSKAYIQADGFSISSSGALILYCFKEPGVNEIVAADMSGKVESIIDVTFIPLISDTPPAAE